MSTMLANIFVTDNKLMPKGLFSGVVELSSTKLTTTANILALLITAFGTVIWLYSV